MVTLQGGRSLVQTWWGGPPCVDIVCSPCLSEFPLSGWQATKFPLLPHSGGSLEIAFNGDQSGANQPIPKQHKTKESILIVNKTVIKTNVAGLAGKFGTCSLRLHPFLDVLVIPQKDDPYNTYIHIYIYQLVKKRLELFVFGWSYLCYHFKISIESGVFGKLVHCPSYIYVCK